MSTLKANRYENTASTDGGINIDSSGRVLVGTSTGETINGDSVNFQVKDTGAKAGLSIHRSQDTNSPPAINLALSRAGAVVSNNDPLGVINFFGHDGTDLNSSGGSINCLVDGTPGSNDMPGRLVFSTTAAGASSPTERLRILSSGGITFNGDTAAANALDDYEEGSWTPSIGGNATYTTQEGSYVKIGKLVLAHWRLQINSQGTGSNISQISGLPFASGKASQNTSNLSWSGLGVGMTYGVYYLGSGGTTLSLSYTTAAQTSLTNNPNSLVDSAAIQGNIVYISN